MKNYNQEDFEEFLEKEEKKYLHESKFLKQQLLTAITGLSSLGISLAWDGSLDSLGFIISGACALNFYKEKEKNKLLTGEYLTKTALNYIENTEEYQKCYTLYRQLLEETAELFVKCSADKDPLMLGILHGILLHNGFLSINNEFNYHNYDIDMGFAYELLGARVCSSTGVCRHITKNSVDLYRLLGHNATYSQVKMLKEDNIYLKHKILLDIKAPKPTHAVTGVVGKDGKFVLDITNSRVINIDRNKKLASALNSKLKYSFGEDKLYTRDSEIERENNEIFKNAPRKIITTEEYHETLKQIEEIASKNFMDLVHYKIKVASLVKDITYYEKVLSDYKDEQKISKMEELINMLEIVIETLKNPSNEFLLVKNEQEKIRKR